MNCGCYLFSWWHPQSFLLEFLLLSSDEMGGCFALKLHGMLFVAFLVSFLVPFLVLGGGGLQPHVLFSSTWHICA